MRYFAHSIFLLASLSLAQTPKVDPSWQVAFERDDNNIYIANSDGSHERLLVKDGEDPKWSRDGEKLAFFRKGFVWIKNMKTGAEGKAFYVGHPKQEGPPTGWIEWDPKLNFILACVQGAKQMIAYQPKGEPGYRLQTLLSGEIEEYVAAPAWSPSGKWLTFAKNGDVWIAQRDTENKFVGDIEQYYKFAFRLAPLAIFSDAEVGVSDTTPYWVDELTWLGDRKIVFHFQRQFGSGVSQIGYLDLTPVSQKENEETDWSKWSGFTYKLHWILDGVFSPRICPDGKTLSYVGSWDDLDSMGLRVCDWEGKHSKLLIKGAFSPDWRPSAATRKHHP